VKQTIFQNINHEGMIMLFSKKSITCMTMLLAAVSLGNVLNARSEKKERRDPLVGSFAVNIPTLGFFGDWSFHEDGTLVFQDSASIQQPTPTAPEGRYGTISVGKWEKICKRSYKLVQASVLSNKDISTRNDCGDLLLAGIPFARLKVEGGLELSEDCKFITGELTLTFYEVADISLTEPLIVNGQPIPPIKTLFIGQRIGFSHAH
jgi:hypothetical protein